MNNIQLVGRLTRDPELNYTPGNGLAIVKFTLAVERPRFDKSKPKEADFINCVMFGKRSETIANYVQKGHRFGVIGRLQINKYVDKKTNENRWSTNVVVIDFEFMQDKTGNGNSNNSSQNIQQNDEYAEIYDEGDIPF
ncbi:single-stranded DNA-binding protein [Clostridium kluyveri]|uniref:single-stranded DNA-binding protein n=1 Tax=Clostridium kluyveri TaxID=1534 RepID=UPI0022486731|nr:single-stranded DNA-binding protein [Clostridium kluyveri]UZQ51606.1 single-stranded DNA-binding protein [Clostridium kluyveri]